ncbi:TraR/DksA family transcriptional regulator [Treponema phagedenis]|uniref:C4-type zinc finger protein, DksA/TraR family n=1 Tax=Treponema phagedenis TaxID=162 RepID=A0A0B7GXE2_TREPH|nr:TraR/DksA family transcriptional regulator [Treponema phagedenis]NVP25104.1 TraR/DksA family transcriptional regulator [Treponema phagedenis]QEJ94105.1 TraR/DksA family transcriptional regulator [Treponema phagedenis]QEJ97218.1 TraR/DksA family transcriptional regulator [Treponema phagedenis]QEK01884.1 TraR/DksA family transcriptional regulator [Treponema phagedenis]QEK02589.1 TraR/DksA family transcriptional regulator [Treponema phagedenis]
MKKEFIDEMKEVLQNNKIELLKTLAAHNEDFNAIIEGVDPKDFGDIAADDTDRKMLESMGAKGVKQLQQIDSALARIEQGKYGKCIKCNKEIPEDRLRALPYALMCIECQSASEQKKKRN